MGGQAIDEGEAWLEAGVEEGGRVSVVFAAGVDLSGEPQARGCSADWSPLTLCAGAGGAQR